MRGAKPDPLPHMFDHETFQTTPRYAQKHRKEKKGKMHHAQYASMLPGIKLKNFLVKHFSTMIRRKVEEALPPRGSTAIVCVEQNVVLCRSVQRASHYGRRERTRLC